MNKSRTYKSFRQIFQWLTTLLFVVSFGVLSFAQSKITGTISDAEGKGLEGVLIEIPVINRFALSGTKGEFTFKNISPATYKITTSLLGYTSWNDSISVTTDNQYIEIQLTTDPLDLESIIVTGTYDPRKKLESSVAITTLNVDDIQRRNARGTADLLKAIPGTFVDASAGEMFTRVFSRGISSSAEDDLGWFYVSLQEEGLPVNLTQHTFYSPDLFHRVDLTTKRLEAIRGGSASITNANSPGGIYNFISKTGGPIFSGEVQATGAYQGDGNGLYRLDVNLGGPLNDKGWTYNVGGFYRYDQGPRNTDINWGNGGQLKFNIAKRYKKGFLKFYGKYLNDKVNRYLGLPANNWENPNAAFDQNFNTTALMLPKVSTNVTDPQKIEEDISGTRTFDTNNGVRAKDFVLGLSLSHEFGDAWSLKNNLKFTSKNANWQSTISNARLGLESFLPYFLTGAESPWGMLVFRDAKTEEVLARVNNLGALNAFAGLPPTFEYIDGSLPNDALLGTAPWLKEDQSREFLYQLSLGLKLGSNDLNLGLFAGRSAVETFTSASFAFATYEPNPRMLQVSLENPGSSVVQLSDAAGITNYGGLFYRGARADVNQVALFLNDHWKISDQLNIDVGLRYEFIAHLGNKDRFQPLGKLGGIDGDTLTAYDNATIAPFGTVDEFDFKYDYLSFSAGINYKLDDQTAVFARFTKGNKAPELNYYFDNFENLPIPNAGKVQGVLQGEFGLKVKTKAINLFATAYWSRLKNISFSEFVFDQGGGNGIFFTPEQINSTTTVGLELESTLTPVENFQIHVLATVQKAEATTFTVYDANRSVDPSDDSILDYSGNDLPHNPNLSVEVTPSYIFGSNRLFLSWRYLGKRQANIANAFELPGFSTFSAGFQTKLNENISASLYVSNLLNSAGLMNFFGPDEFGASANVVTKEYVRNNPDATFIVVPILPRTISLQMNYAF